MVVNELALMWFRLYTMVKSSDPLVVLNVLLCSAIVCRLAFFRKTGYRHRAWVAWLAWFLIGVYSWIPFRFIAQQYQDTHWGVITANLIICIALYRVKGNIAKLLHSLRPQ
ncbi:Protein of uncharacterised function (DUF754) [Serratia ficaria]|uniref:phage holin family protein n=1 Tax=Serratia ficaria TaxID=61651 RepID=UPI0021C4E24C|nr:phage holin family protein [Serratia ficaria]CAI2786410.1 Protein of uncharacterised function (DUF754) [Serratia ficaria]